MDLRDIQRLHAQYSPDTITIDLPRQIAALPAPTAFGSNAAPPSARSRWTSAAPAVRASIIAIAAFAMVGMAGIGAASLYKASRSQAPTGAPPSITAAAGHTGESSDEAPRIANTTSKDIAATPAQPVDPAPRLTASDLASTPSLGLTADQFRNSLKTREVTAQISGTGRSDTATSSEIDRAANSPIHRAPAARVQEAQPGIAVATAQVTPTAPVASNNVAPAPKSADSVLVQPVPQQAVSVTPVVAPQVTPQAPAAQIESVPVKTAHLAHHHIAKPRAPQSEDANTVTPTAAPAKSGPSARAGSNEVQMF
jgi:hypothetical protein